jgi:hypothetical protein
MGIGLSRVAVSGVSGGVCGGLGGTVAAGASGEVSVGVMAHRNAENCDRIEASNRHDRAASDHRWFIAIRSRVMRLM